MKHVSINVHESVRRKADELRRRLAKERREAVSRHVAVEVALNEALATRTAKRGGR